MGRASLLGLMARFTKVPIKINSLGQYVDGKMEGKGVFTWSNGKRYVGEFLQDKMHGNGESTSPDGTSYEGIAVCIFLGQYVDSRMEGKGVYTCADGLTYVGDFLQNKRHGYGMLTWPKGNFYEGTFENS
jgi:hypothetical protein